MSVKNSDIKKLFSEIKANAVEDVAPFQGLVLAGQELPGDLIGMTCLFLAHQDLIALSLTNKALRSVDDELLWNHFCLRLMMNAKQGKGKETYKAAQYIKKHFPEFIINWFTLPRLTRAVHQDFEGISARPRYESLMNMTHSASIVIGHFSESQDPAIVLRLNYVDKKKPSFNQSTIVVLYKKLVVVQREEESKQAKETREVRELRWCTYNSNCDDLLLIPRGHDWEGMCGVDWAEREPIPPELVGGNWWEEPSVAPHIQALVQAEKAMIDKPRMLKKVTNCLLPLFESRKNITDLVGDYIGKSVAFFNDCTPLTSIPPVEESVAYSPSNDFFEFRHKSPSGFLQIAKAEKRRQ